MVIFLHITYWHWWGLAALLIIGELLSPCVYFLAWGVAAAVTGLVTRLVPGMPGEWQVGLFIVLSAITLSFAYYVRHRGVRNRGQRQEGGETAKPDSQEPKS